MTALQTLDAILCVLAISAGQLLFKRTGMEIEASQSWLTLRALLWLGAALVIYGLATLVWIELLRHVALNKAYIFFALSFVFVPLASYFLFDEALNQRYVFGALLIVAGILVITQSGA